MAIYVETVQGAGPDPLGTRETHALPQIKPGASVKQTVNAKALAEELRGALQGEVRFDSQSRALYATDGSNYRQIPIGVVVPKSIDDVVRTVAIARKHGAPILSRGGGTSLAGQCCNVAVVMDFSKYLHRVLAVDSQRRLGTVQPGCVLDDLRNEANKYGLTFGPDPATHSHNTLGGMCGNDSCGVHSVMAQFLGNGPRTAENIEELEILTYDGLRMRVGPTSDAELERIIRAGGRRGQIYADLKALRDQYADRIRERFPHIPRRVSGYNLEQLLPENGFNVARALVGTESTCVVYLEIVASLIPDPPVRSLLLLGYPDIYQAGDHVPQVMAHQPTACEGIDKKLFEYYRHKGLHLERLALMPEGEGYLIVEFGGATKEESDGKARALMAELRKRKDTPTLKLYDNPEQEEMILKVRESGLGTTAFVPGHPDTWEGWEDSAVPPEHVGDYLRGLRKLFDKYGFDACLYGHLGQGCIHTRIPFDLVSHDGIEQYRAFMNEAGDLVLSFGGSLSGEHGDGQSRAEFLPRMFGPELVEAFREFKRIWDPENRMNPGKVVDAYSITDNLRLGADYNPARPQTHFKFADDRYDFSRAALRCVGVGECRRESGQTMCPSYMVTREEKDCTRGRARLLFEMLQGEVIQDGWKSEEVKDALDLCLMCKGCKGDCPVNVDMATYKAEFLSHYYEGRRRPRYAYAFGFIDKWARLASPLALLVDLVAKTPGLRDVAKAIAGMRQEREIPRFAAEPFMVWWSRRKRRPRSGPEVVLWPDTFNNYFHPTTAQAAVEVLESAGFTVRVPNAHVCCGRPLYDYGFLDHAEAYLKRVLDVMRPEIRSGVPIVVLEPSCAAVFRDELVNLMPEDNDARRLHDQTFLLSEFLAKKAPDWKPPQLSRKAILWGHCHHKALMGMKDEEKVLRDMGVAFDQPKTSCCGMAGSFGFENAPGHFEVAEKSGDLALLPAVRNAPDESLIVADGFSCREMIRQHTDRQGLHLAQVLKMALDTDPADAPCPNPEQAYVRESSEAIARSAAKTALIVGGFALVVGGAVWSARSQCCRRRAGE